MQAPLSVPSSSGTFFFRSAGTGHPRVRGEHVECRPGVGWNIYFYCPALRREKPLIRTDPVGNGSEPGQPPNSGRIISDGNQLICDTEIVPQLLCAPLPFTSPVNATAIICNMSDKWRPDSTWETMGTLLTTWTSPAQQRRNVPFSASMPRSLSI